MTNYYVYYRVDPARVPSLRLEIDQLFETMHRQSGVRGRWLQRCEDPSTYMEVYEGVADEPAFEALLARESSTLDLERKTERFRMASPCA